MIGFAVALAIGSWLILQQPQLPALWVWSLLIMLAGVMARTFSPSKSVIAGLLVGAVVAAISAERHLVRQLPVELANTELSVTGTITGIPDHEPLRSVFVLQVMQFDGAVSFAPQRLRVSWYRPGSRRPAAGERWQFTVKLRDAVSLGNPGSFDYRRWLFQQRIDALATVRDSPPPVHLAAAPGWQLDTVRAALAARIAALPGADHTVGLMQALALGLGHGVSDEQRAILRDSGTAHLLAISGLHIGLVASWAFVLAGWVWRWRPGWQSRVGRRPFALAAGAVAAFAYALCAGFALPTQRALLMLLVVAIAGFTHRSIGPPKALSVALVLVVLVDPLALLSPGFWLSFGTVTALLYLHRGHIHVVTPVRKLFGVHAQLGIVLLPVTAWFFDSGAVIAPLANLVAIPLVGMLVVPLALCTLMLAVPLPSVANLSLVAGQWLLARLLEGLDLSMDALAGSVPLSLPGGELFMLALAGVLLAMAPRGIGVRRYALPLLLPALWFNLSPRQVEGLEVHVLDVGQGLAVLVLTREHTLLYDTGDQRSPGVSQVTSLIMPYLRQQGRRKIDSVVISHPDRDHSAGWADLHALFPEAQWHASQPAAMPETDAVRCEAGHNWSLDGVGLAFLHPAAHDQGSDNDLSCTLLIHLGASRILLTGDIEARAETLLVRRTGALPVTLMTAPHHGSRTSSGDDLLDAFTPEHVVFPAGRDNRYGFPHPDVRLRYTLRGAETFVSGIDGATVFRFDHRGLRQPPDTWWRSNRRIWHRSGE